MRGNNYVLCHYGILGMKWGVRRTPEQLGHKAKGRKKTAAVEGQPLKYDSPGARKARAYAAMVPLNVLARIVPGGALLWNASVVDQARKRYDMKDYKSPQSKLSELHKKSEKASSDILVDVGLANDTGRKGNVMNCFNCVSALEMRQRGYDVKATKRSSGVSTSEYLNYYTGLKINNTFSRRGSEEKRKSYVQRMYKQLCNDIEYEGPNARGFLSFQYEKADSGHTIMWATDSKGSVSFFDPQNGSKNATNIMPLSNQDYLWGRLDICGVSDNITDLVENRKRG